MTEKAFLKDEFAEKTLYFLVPIVQWIEHEIADLKIHVRLLVGANKPKNLTLLIFISSIELKN